MVSGRSRSNQCTWPLSTRSNLVFRPVPISTTVAAGCAARNERTQKSRIAVRRTVTNPPAPRPPPAAGSVSRHLPGVVDRGGPRADGSFLVAAAGRLLIRGRDGTLTPFARGAGGYQTAQGT